MTLLKTHHGGWIKQDDDPRDFKFVPSVPFGRTPGALSLDVLTIPYLNQLQQGSCTGHGSAGPVMYCQRAQGQQIVVPAREMIYYDARRLEGTTDQDAGAQVRDALKGLAKWGVCADSEFPYNDQVFDVAPSATNYKEGSKQRALVYEAVQYPHINEAIASGYPVVFGFSVYESFESDTVAQTGVVPVPESGEQVIGGHCVWMWGYNSTLNPFQSTAGAKTIPPRTKACRNSWGQDWGDGGDFYLPQWFWDSGNCSDHWVVRKIGA